MTAARTPSIDIDIYSDELTLRPYEAYRQIRDAGPAVYLAPHDTWVIARYENVREVLKDTDTFSSAAGVSLTAPVNEITKGTTLASDPPEHDTLRAIVASSLTPRALATRKPGIAQQAEQLVAGLVERGEFDAVTELAQVLPLSVVPDFVGLPQEGRDQLLDWASAVFNAIGPPNERSQRSLPALAELGEYAGRLANSGALAEGSLGAGVLAAAADGRIPATQCPALLLDYLGPALDTTISAVGSAIYLFARHPEQWDKVRQDPKLIPNAFNEVVRLETPIRGFCRQTTRPTVVGGVEIGAGERVLVLYASANRDERKWQDPEKFDVTRRAGDHVGFGYGVHGCAGQGLARIEAHAVLEALAKRVSAFEVLGTDRVLNNVIRAFSSIRVRVTTSNGV
ncbi:cytochrome P450 [Amycolatopsis endophytica]|uniref:Cytochrome P450 n=1 Tax=Amycolatopsis endophytica TaxID=860233 RepID=A0A853B1T1_9PSEU|nr:cytochrome P450 [Amycolatopsis endophytica]NYI88822.1 cytochrome P450 [Amycolatopsis endophytica]